MGIKSFEDALTKVYLENPCRVLPNALWKTLKQTNNFYNKFEVDVDNEEVIKLQLWNEETLYTYWNKYSSRIDIEEETFTNFKMVIAHESQLSEFIINEFPTKESYFRIIYDYSVENKINITQGFEFRNVRVETQLREISDLICNCYENLKPNIEEVDKWTKHQVFKEDLWVWVIDKQTNKPVGLGIAEYDSTIREGSLEWIQVLPEYRGKGLGKSIITELIVRLKKYAEFITVSGQVDNKTNPEKSYRECGFRGNDVWYVLKSEKLYML